MFKKWLSIFMVLAISLSMFVTQGMAAPLDDPEAVNTICEVRLIETPVAGHFPSSLYKYPYKANLYNNTSTTAAVGNGFAQTLTWEPEIEKVFQPNTEYTVTLLLEPNSGWSNCGMPGGTNRSFAANDITPDMIGGLPTEGVKSLSYEYDGVNMLIHITFDATGSEMAAPEYVFYEDFSKGVHEDKTIGEGYFMMAQQANRQGLGNWRDNMTSVRVREDGGSELVLGYKKDPTGTSSSNKYVKNNWITAGGVRTRGRSASQGGGAYGLDDITYEHTYGYYEANVKFPQSNVVWGAFWLFSPATAAPLTRANGGSKYATEIDIIESCGYLTKFFNAAYHTYRASGDRIQNQASEEVPIFSGYEETGVDIYDGEFHRIGLEWSPTDYIFTVDDVVIGSWSDLDSHYFDEDVPYSDWAVIKQNEGVLQNPAYIKLTVEAAEWADESWDDDWADDPTNPWGPGDGRLGISPDEGEMVVDYVYILNGPKPANDDPAPSAVNLTTNAFHVKKGDYFNLNASFKEEQISNAVVLNYTFDGDKFEYANYAPVDGVKVLDTQFGDGYAKITLMVAGYNAENLGDIMLRAKENAELKREKQSVSVTVDYVLRDDLGGKTINTATASASFTTLDVERGLEGDTNGDGIVDLIDLSNIIDWFGYDDSNADWDDIYTYFDFNNNGEIDILDISYVASLIK